MDGVCVMQGIYKHRKFFLVGPWFFASALPAYAQGTEPLNNVHETIAGLAPNLIFLIILGLILLVAKRNKQGMDVPLKWSFFSFKGRINRKAYWLKGVVPVSMIMLAVQLTMSLTMLPILYFMGEQGALLVISVMVVFLVPLVVFQMWTGLALAFKRIHDRGRSAWFLLLGLIPFVNFWVMIEVAFLRGTEGDNDYGPDPLVSNPFVVANIGEPSTNNMESSASNKYKKSFFAKEEKPHAEPREPEDSRSIIKNRLGSDMFAEDISGPDSGTSGMDNE